MRQAEKERKKIQSRILFIPDDGKKIPKKQQKNLKNKKTSFRHYFQPKWDVIGRERLKKNLVLNSVHTRPWQENSETNRKKNQKIKKLTSSKISIQKGLRDAEKEKKKFQSRITFLPQPGKKIPKKITKKFKKSENLFLELFLAKTGCDRLRK